MGAQESSPHHAPCFFCPLSPGAPSFVSSLVYFLSSAPLGFPPPHPVHHLWPRTVYQLNLTALMDKAHSLASFVCPLQRPGAGIHTDWLQKTGLGMSACVGYKHASPPPLPGALSSCRGVRSARATPVLLLLCSCPAPPDPKTPNFQGCGSALGVCVGKVGDT